MNHDVTILLRDWAAGDEAARDKLIPLCYEALRGQARRALNRETRLSLTTTGLVHQLYLRLTRYQSPDLMDRGHFMAFCSRLMRQIITDEARACFQTQKRGDASATISLCDEIAWIGERDTDYLDLDRALDALKAEYPTHSRIVELRFYLGCSAEEASEAVGISKATADRHWAFARAWLFQRLRQADHITAS
jgi:RNA polymerase sigma factor (TIGR02999 family)